MRSRPAMTVLLTPGAPRPGESVEVEARLVATSETPVDRISFDLLSTETVAVPRGKTRVVVTRPHLHLRADHAGTTLSVGEHSYRAKFEIPAGIPAQYLGRFARIEHTLEVRVDIPWWPDRVGRYEVPVVAWPVPAQVTSGVFVSTPGGAQPGELYTELSLASTVIEPGGEISGVVAFTNVAAARPRGVRVALVAIERLFAENDFWSGGPIRESREVLRSERRIKEDAPEEGVGIPFRVGLTTETVPSFSAAISALEWKIEVVIEGLLSTTPLVQVPITIVPAGSGVKRTAQSLAPAVGRERRVQSFQHVGERVGLAYDAEHDDLHGTIGSVTIRAGVETRPDGTLATVAHLAWPSLGMRLRVEPGSWTDRLAPDEIEVGHEHFDRRFRVRSRVPEQAKALLDVDVCALLVTPSEVVIDDEGASLSLSVALVDEAPLAEFVSLAVKAARAFDSAFGRVPPPPLLAEHAAAWRAFAARLGGRFEPGRGAIHDATFGLERVTILTRWSDRGELQGTDVEMPLGARVDPDAIAPAPRALADALRERSGGSVAIGEETITLSLAKIVPDPAGLEPLLEDMTRLVHAVRGRGAAGPFR